jgi:hypothetical protein
MKVSELPPAHWVRSAAVRYLGTLIWEEAHALPTTQHQHKLDLLLEAFKVTHGVYGLNISTEGDVRPRPSEAERVANNLLYYALDFIEAGGDREQLRAAGLSDENIQQWLMTIGADDVSQVTNINFLDTIRRGWLYLKNEAGALAAATAVMELLGGESGLRPDRAEVLREARGTIERLQSHTPQ